MAVPESRLSRRNKSRIPAREAASKALLGSSATSRRGLMQHGHGDEYALRLADAHLAGVAAQEGVILGKSHAAEESAEWRFRLRPWHRRVRAPGFADLGFQAQRGVERRQRVWQGGGDLAAANAAQVAFAASHQVAPAEQDLAAQPGRRAFRAGGGYEFLLWCGANRLRQMAGGPDPSRVPGGSAARQLWPPPALPLVCPAAEDFHRSRRPANHCRRR